MATRFCDITHHTRGKTECYLPLKLIKIQSLTLFKLSIINLLTKNKNIISTKKFTSERIGRVTQQEDKTLGFARVTSPTAKLNWH